SAGPAPLRLRLLPALSIVVGWRARGSREKIHAEFQFNVHHHPPSIQRPRQALLRACLDDADTRSRGVDCDALDLTLSLRALADGQAQHTVLELCVDLLGINIGAKLERALELALPALAINRTVVFGFLFALERQQAIMEGHLDVFLLHAGQFGDELDLIIRLADLDMRPPATRPT